MLAVVMFWSHRHQVNNKNTGPVWGSARKATYLVLVLARMEYGVLRTQDRHVSWVLWMHCLLRPRPEKSAWLALRDMSSHLCPARQARAYDDSMDPRPKKDTKLSVLRPKYRASSRGFGRLQLPPAATQCTSTTGNTTIHVRNVGERRDAPPPIWTVSAALAAGRSSALARLPDAYILANVMLLACASPDLGAMPPPPTSTRTVKQTLLATFSPCSNRH